jgi:hypothetical protein
VYWRDTVTFTGHVSQQSAPQATTPTPGRRADRARFFENHHVRKSRSPNSEAPGAGDNDGSGWSGQRVRSRESRCGRDGYVDDDIARITGSLRDG